MEARQEVAATNQTHTIDDATMESLVIDGDLSRLTSGQRLQVYKARCDAAGLDPRTGPFEYIRLNGRLVLYARKAATDQLSAIHKAQCKILSRETVDDIHTVIVNVTLADGRSMDDAGCVPVKGLAGDALANAMLKAISKARRRATLSICGLGMMDESELDTVKGAQPAWEAPPRTLEAVVLAHDHAEAPAATATPIAPGEKIDTSTLPPWEEWYGEKIGGANQTLCDLSWETLTTTDYQPILGAANKLYAAGLAQQNSTGKPPPERYQKLAVALEIRKQLAQPSVPSAG